MATDPALPPSLAAMLADLERRIANLERSPRLPFSSTRGGLFEFRDEDGNLRFGLGNVALPPNTFIAAEDIYGTTMWDDGGAVVMAALEGTRGLVYPVMHAGFHDPDPKFVTSGSFISAFETYADHPPGPVLRVTFAVQSDVGTTGEVKLTDGLTLSSTSTLSIPSGTNGLAQFTWLHPATSGIGDDRVGREPTIFPSIQARRVSGAGNVYIYAPTRQYFASTIAYPDAATDGNPVLE